VLRPYEAKTIPSVGLVFRLTLVLGFGRIGRFVVRMVRVCLRCAWFIWVGLVGVGWGGIGVDVAGT
jgi:hypothetical protein